MIKMVFAWKKIRNSHKGGRKNVITEGILDLELEIPNHFCCPISLDLMNDPVTLSTGITYDRESIEKWIDSGHQTCPFTNQTLRNFDQIPNHSLRRMIQEWCVDNKSFGIERITTPKIPVSNFEVSKICSRIEDASGLKDSKTCQELLDKIKGLAKESDRNKKCFIECGVGNVLSSLFESFSNDSTDKHVVLLKSILSLLTWISPLGLESQSKLGSSKSLLCIGVFLNGEDLTSRQHALVVLKDLVFNGSNQICGDIVNQIPHVEDALLKILRVSICHSDTKSAIIVIYHILLASNTNEKVISRFLEMGLVSTILEILVDGDKNISEIALRVLDCVCNWEEGRKIACNNALIMPLLVKKILRISDIATEFSVSILWRLCKDEDESYVIDAMELGGFEKLLVILQVGCGEKTKEKTNELLKLMNLYRDRVDCLEGSSGFKYINRTF